MFKNTRNSRLITFICTMSLCVNLSGCPGSRQSEKSLDAAWRLHNPGYVFAVNDSLFYYQFEDSLTNLYVYDLISKENKYIDNITNAETQFSGLVQMHLIDGKIYYGKSTSDSTISYIYSINTENPIPQLEGKIRNDDGESTKNYNGDALSSDFNIFKINNKIYILSGNKVYSLDEGVVVEDNVNSLYIYGDKIYYSLLADGEYLSTGIFGYDINNETIEEIVSDEKIKEANSKTVSGDQSFVRNIFVDEDNVFFLGAEYYSNVFGVKRHENSEIENYTADLMTQSFRKYNDKLYYVDSKNNLCCADINSKENTQITSGEYVYSYNVFDESIFYYTLDYSGLPSKLTEYSLKTGSKAIVWELQLP